jgi:predicted metal-binding membrane protein
VPGRGYDHHRDDEHDHEHNVASVIVDRRGRPVLDGDLVPDSRSRAGADSGAQLLVAASLLILAGLAWAWTAAMAAMPECHRLGLPSFVLMWTVMMAAMMFPAVVPVVLAFTALARARRGSPTLAAAAFVAGYLVVWGALGVPAEALLAGAARLAAALPALARLGGPVLVLCGVYQLTPFKDACLRHCRLPLLFLGHHWRDGLGGALLLGAHHGLYCAGCCAALMVVLLVVGVMNVGWMVALSALIYLEKVLPAGGLVGRLAGLGLCAAGAARMLG